MTETLNFIDWSVIIIFILSMLGVGAFFTRKGSADIESYFISNRSLPWYIAGGSLIATSFAADTPLWITSLVRQYGVYYIWQFWAPLIGAALCVVLFARLWRRLGVMTDIEFLEVRYSGKAAKVLRFYSGTMLAAFFCPLIIGWVTKAMETISREAMGIPEEYRMYSTAGVVATALILCTLSGLYGVVYSDFLQFVIATIGTLILAILAVRHVGGLEAMTEKLSQMSDWNGRNLNIAPSIGSGPTQMSLWNAVGYFGVLWLVVAVSGGYQAQRLLACKDWRHSTLAMYMHTICYYGLVCWPWIIVALCSVIIFPSLGEGVSDDNAYPRMITLLLPAGLRGMVIAAMLAAFVSTISTMFNWGSSYLVNDVYKRFLVKNASKNHYVWIARGGTLLMAAAGGLISFLARDIQQLLSISFVIGASFAVIAMLRWFWWRLNAIGDLAATAVSWTVTPLILFTDVLDTPARMLLRFNEAADFGSDPNLLGARMSFAIIVVSATAVIVSLLTKPTDMELLKSFLLKARPFGILWKPVIRELDEEYHSDEPVIRTLISWTIATLCVGSLIFGIGKLLLGSPKLGLFLLAVFAVTFIITYIRIDQDYKNARENKDM
ncbi:Na(+)/glucose symporter [Limihaloglobus sulfuriphilus]|uniref:Na(+)/glucose symporter n=1 Tax=Limihaloglobus sulfuriphilus TaxID=1851148 RepID=A0A1Q2MCM0_9BACT|nr:sodium:solute symporter family protein [Limihaloglobus sulfuriphilus]AQQ70047.1 Na(+)/glucose symporter [Limihaloglobus sulfuriphilus]